MKRIKINDESFFKIENSDKLRPFFMSIVSDSNHWMFISSNGGISAGRKNAEYSLFPYYTDDKITESNEITGSKTIIRLNNQNWEPFSIRQKGLFNTSQSVYKNLYGNKIIFEEINHDWQLAFSYQWSNSSSFGFIRESSVRNLGSSPKSIQVLDGIQNVLPFGVGSDLQNGTSNLVDAYKRTELVPDVGLGIFALSAIIVDKAEPSEALKANVAWSCGLDSPTILLSSLQLDAFRNGETIHTEEDIKGEKGAYFVGSKMVLNENDKKNWYITANVNLSHSSIIDLIENISDENMVSILKRDIDKGTDRLKRFTASADGLQSTADQLRDTRHYSNVLFNIMRGGIFDHNYQIERQDFNDYLSKANSLCFSKAYHKNLPLTFDHSYLIAYAEQTKDKDFIRLATEYLPLKFSRRHGDPSRPWNKFSINIYNEVDGSKILDYEGNWRDIFQNWEALAFSFPNFTMGMIFKFLNASTFEGFNPYRVTKDGFDWETIEPDNPWSYIGYWGDHQIIYLLKFLELQNDIDSSMIEKFLNADLFVYANVPYKIKPYTEIYKNPKDTIEFDEHLDKSIRQEREKLGADAALLKKENGSIHRVNMMEKLLSTLLSKLSNFIPDAGIWMNTQRPEWNDANNALVGNGVSMVTLYYLRRFLHFISSYLNGIEKETFLISKELLSFYQDLKQGFIDHKGLLDHSFNDEQRKKITDSLGTAGSNYRCSIYNNAFSGDKEELKKTDIIDFFNLCLSYIDHTILANKREDKLFHAYNILNERTKDKLSIGRLSEMLEGQVAVISSGLLDPREVLEVLDAMKSSLLFRPDQYSYLLYPNKELPGFLDRNNIPAERVIQSSFLKTMVSEGNKDIISKDSRGNYHFNGEFRNARLLSEALERLENSKYSELIKEEKENILHLYEEVFNHKSFTGRSGTFYGYEGLGSIYWHMVSKLQLAIMENCHKAFENNETKEIIGRLIEHYYEVNAGIGVHKSPELYGAFPTDPYSHTPFAKGAQQPGMTGQVKEDIISRYGELGIKLRNGQILFSPGLLRATEFATHSTNFEFYNVIGERNEIALASNSLVFLFCQIPIIYEISDTESITVSLKNGDQIEHHNNTISKELSQHIFARDNEVVAVKYHVPKSKLI